MRVMTYWMIKHDVHKVFGVVTGNFPTNLSVFK